MTEPYHRSLIPNINKIDDLKIYNLIVAAAHINIYYLGQKDYGGTKGLCSVTSQKDSETISREAKQSREKRARSMRSVPKLQLSRRHLLQLVTGPCIRRSVWLLHPLGALNVESELTQL